jgi:hypothetical protein
MKKTVLMKTIAPLLLLLGLCGCGPGYTFSPYVGQQQNWMTNPGAYTKVVDNATLFPPGQLPPRPYVIIGSITADDDDAIARAVHEQHADAAIVSPPRVYHEGSVAWAVPGAVFAEPITHTVLTANLIRYK